MTREEKELVSKLFSTLRKSIQINKELLLKYSYVSNQLSKYQYNELEAYTKRIDCVGSDLKEIIGRLNEKQGSEENKGRLPENT